MTCVHLQQLYRLCQDNQLMFSSSDLLNIVCKQCQKQEVCPSVLFDEYEATHAELDDAVDDQDSGGDAD